MDEYLIILAKYGRAATIGASLFSLMGLVLYVLWYVSSNTEEKTSKKILDVFLMLFYLFLFPLYLVVGLFLVSVVLGLHPALGILAGVMAFWGVITLKTTFQKRRADRLKEKRRELQQRLQREQDAIK